MNDFDIAEWISQNQEVFLGDLEYAFEEGNWYLFEGEARRKANRPEIAIAIMRRVRKVALLDPEEIPATVLKKINFLGTGPVAYRVIGALTNILREERKARDKVWPKG